MAGIQLRQSASSPVAAANPGRNLGSSPSPCSLSLQIFTRRPVGRSRVVSVGVAPVARFGRGGGGYRPSPGRGGSRRPPGTRPPSSDSDDEALDFSRLTYVPLISLVFAAELWRNWILSSSLLLGKNIFFHPGRETIRGESSCCMTLDMHWAVLGLMDSVKTKIHGNWDSSWQR